MPTARHRLVSLEDTPYYHCISRCVRRAFPCGTDDTTGYNFEHLRQCIVDRINLLCSVFAVDLCVYAVMSDHYHIVVRLDSETAKSWTDKEVAERWTRLFNKSALIHRFTGGSALRNDEQEQALKLIVALAWERRYQVPDRTVR